MIPAASSSNAKFDACSFQVLHPYHRSHRSTIAYICIISGTVTAGHDDDCPGDYLVQRLV